MLLGKTQQYEFQGQTLHFHHSSVCFVVLVKDYRLGKIRLVGKSESAQLMWYLITKLPFIYIQLLTIPDIYFCV